MKITAAQLRRIISEEAAAALNEATVMVKDPETGARVSIEVQPGSMPGTVKLFVFAGGGRATEVTLPAADAANLAAAIDAAAATS